MRDEISDRIAEVISETTSAKSRDPLAELARYYLRPIVPKNLAASRATLSNWQTQQATVAGATGTPNRSRTACAVRYTDRNCPCSRYTADGGQAWTSSSPMVREPTSLHNRHRTRLGTYRVTPGATACRTPDREPLPTHGDSGVPAGRGPPTARNPGSRAAAARWRPRPHCGAAPRGRRPVGQSRFLDMTALRLIVVNTRLDHWRTDKTNFVVVSDLVWRQSAWSRHSSARNASTTPHPPRPRGRLGICAHGFVADRRSWGAGTRTTG